MGISATKGLLQDDIDSGLCRSRVPEEAMLLQIRSTDDDEVINEVTEVRTSG